MVKKLVGKPVKLQLSELYAVRDNHKIWKNPLLIACNNGELTFEDFQFLFSQYYLYSKNFTRYLAGFMYNCESDYYRSKLSENLWEEGGGTDIEKRHAEIFRIFLQQYLQIASLDDITFEPYTKKFVKQYLQLCSQSNPLEGAAALSLGTEGIVARLYTIFRSGLLKVGLSNNTLLFFNLHIGCDDEHARTLEEIVLFYADQDNWFERCKIAINTTLDLRDTFFNHMYRTILSRKGLDYLIKRATTSKKLIAALPLIDNVKYTSNFTGNLLYKNNQSQAGIGFLVERLPFKADILDSRLVCIAVGKTNESHSHAHETVFLILAGRGEVKIGEQSFPVQEGDIVFVPRWLTHQTRNTGNNELRFFAITDYGFTKCFPKNTESVYRQKKPG